MALAGRTPIGQLRHAIPGAFSHANARYEARRNQPKPEVGSTERLEAKARVASELRSLRAQPGFKHFEDMQRARHAALMHKIATEEIKDLTALARLQGQVFELDLMLRQLEGIEQEGQRAAQALSKGKEPSE